MKEHESHVLAQAAEYTVILFYNYTRIENPEALRDSQRALCERLGLKGRTIIAHEGINGTFEGPAAAVEEYVKDFLSDPRFANTHIKRSVGDGKAFPRLSIKVRKEIVTLGLDPKDDVDPNQTTGIHLKPKELHTWLRDGKDIAIVDMRNDYEHKVGHFKGSVLPPLGNFRDLPKALPTLEHLKDKTVVTVCTGGVRCEKASGYLVKNGFKDVYQLDGGIVSYMEKYQHEPEQDFAGSLYVFDERITMAFKDAKDREIVGTCTLCGVKSERYANCALDSCHSHFIVCESCVPLTAAGDVAKMTYSGKFCSPECGQEVK